MMLQKNPTLFSKDFQSNKQALTKLAVIRSKQLRNQVAGYITAALSREAEEEEEMAPELTVTEQAPEAS